MLKSPFPLLSIGFKPLRHEYSTVWTATAQHGHTLPGVSDEDKANSPQITPTYTVCEQHKHQALCHP